MMNKKRLVNILLFLVMLMMPVFVKAYTITVEQSNSHHEYQAYQIFAGTVSSDGHMSNITWGSGVDTTALLADHPEYTNPQTVAGTLTTEPAARQFANLINDYLTTIPTTSCQITSTSCSMTVSGGYYLIKDVDTSLNNSSEVYTPYILKVFGNENVRPKMSTTPYFDHDVVVSNNEKSSTSASIGENIQFAMKATLPDDYSLYESYKLVFTGTVGAAFNFDPDSIVVQVDGSTITTGFTTNIEGSTFTVTFDNLKSISSVVDSSQIKVKYQASLNSNAQTGLPGNQNSGSISYTNNPNEPTALTGISEVLNTSVYTGEIKIHIIDEDGESLPGGTYTLTKSNGTVIPGVVDQDDPSIVSFVGVGNGIYIISQTTPPDSYEPMEDITIEVDVDGDDAIIVIVDISNDDVVIDSHDYYVLLDIPTKYSALLAFTGGRGTLIFTISGLTLMGIAMILAIIRKKKSDLED